MILGLNLKRFLILNYEYISKVNKKYNIFFSNEILDEGAKAIAEGLKSLNNIMSLVLNLEWFLILNY